MNLHPDGHGRDDHDPGTRIKSFEEVNRHGHSRSNACATRIRRYTQRFDWMRKSGSCLNTSARVSPGRIQKGKNRIKNVPVFS